MSDQPLVSVVVPVFNAEAVLAETLSSAQNQTYRRLEVLVVNDGSTDDSARVAKSFAASDPRFKVFEQPNSGSAVARNAALKNARGEWIAFLDADDFWLPAKLSTQLELAQSDSRANLIFSNYRFWDGVRDLELRYTERKRFPEGDVSKKIIYWNLFGTSTLLVKRELVERAGGFDPAFVQAQDWDLWLRLVEQGVWARGVWEALSRYRVWNNGISNNRLRNAQCVVGILEKALTRPHPGWRAREYRRALRQARAHVEFARARPLIESQPEAVPPLVLRGWSHCRSRVKWLLWYAALKVPRAAGGRSAAEIVYRKLRKKW